jgi:hypothetical protein
MTTGILKSLSWTWDFPTLSRPEGLTFHHHHVQIDSEINHAIATTSPMTKHIVRRRVTLTKGKSSIDGSTGLPVGVFLSRLFFPTLASMGSTKGRYRHSPSAITHRRTIDRRSMGLANACGQDMGCCEVAKSVLVMPKSCHLEFFDGSRILLSKHARLELDAVPPRDAAGIECLCSRQSMRSLLLMQSPM